MIESVDQHSLSYLVHLQSAAKIKYVQGKRDVSRIFDIN